MAEEIAKSPERVKVLEKIAEYEKKGWFNKDMEDDPPAPPLTPDKVDYLNEKFSSKFLTFITNIIARRFIDKLIKNKQLIIKDVIGMENFDKIKDSGAIMTCNHFNPFDNFAIHKIFEKKCPIIYKVIREGNYTAFPGLYGFFFRHCNTLPLSSLFSTQKIFMNAVDVLLKRGEKILIYPEQAMWWNYRKPRPLAKGSFVFSVKSKVPVLPIFITMKDSDLLDSDGFPVQEYTIHILEPIYPDPKKTDKENIEYLKDTNYEMWKAIYEDVYGIPLVYSTENEEQK